MYIYLVFLPSRQGHVGPTGSPGPVGPVGNAVGTSSNPYMYNRTKWLKSVDI